MIDGPLAKFGVAGLALGGLWLLGLGVDRAGGRLVTERSAAEGALLPEVAAKIELPPPAPLPKHSARVALSVPQVTSVDAGSVRVLTPGYVVDASQSRPVLQYRKPSKPKPRSIMLVLDNSMSMVESDGVSPPSDPGYLRLNACRRLLASLSNDTDRVSLAVFPCRFSIEIDKSRKPASKPFELLAQGQTPAKVSEMLETLRREENYTTPLYQGIEDGALTLGSEDAGRQRLMVLLTDGKNTWGPPGGLQRAVDAVSKAGVDTYAIALGAEADESTLEQISPHVLRADDASGLDNTFKKVIEQISREVVQVDMDLVVSRRGAPIPSAQPIEIEFRSNGKLYTVKGRTK